METLFRMIIVIGLAFIQHAMFYHAIERNLDTYWSFIATSVIAIAIAVWTASQKHNLTVNIHKMSSGDLPEFIHEDIRDACKKHDDNYATGKKKRFVSQETREKRSKSAKARKRVNGRFV
jgi:hypothetical protein